MRFSGQGLMSHTSTTAISRFFDKSRGKALSIIWFGLSTAEFILPVFITYLTFLYSWRIVWQGIALLTIILLPIIIFKCIQTIKLDSREEALSSDKKTHIKQWTRLEVIKDYKFYIVSLNMLAGPWIITGIFIYQSFISEAKGWNVFVIPKAFMFYSIMSILSLILSGFLVDKFTSRKLIPIVNIPLLLSMITLILFDHDLSAFIFLGLIGITNGLANVLGSSTWAEIYGVKFIGSIKALTTALMVFSTAFGTALFGILIDQGFSIVGIALISAIYIVVSLVLLLIFRKRLKPVDL
tara:strand:+ start:144 stop:1031 length:888 start_codon:yes stop_codon:yes gene_type:complete